MVANNEEGAEEANTEFGKQVCFVNRMSFIRDGLALLRLSIIYHRQQSHLTIQSYLRLIIFPTAKNKLVTNTPLPKTIHATAGIVLQLLVLSLI
jgi:hypothetical protein